MEGKSTKGQSDMNLGGCLFLPCITFVSGELFEFRISKIKSMKVFEIILAIQVKSKINE